AGQVIKNAPGEVGGWYLANNAGAVRYVKLYDQATAPDLTATPKLTIAVPANSAANVLAPAGVDFTAGISARASTGVADHGTWVATIDSGQANVTVSADLVLSSSASDDGPVVRFQDANNYWFADASGSNNFLLYEKTGGSFVQRASTAFTVATGTTYTVQVQ